MELHSNVGGGGWGVHMCILVSRRRGRKRERKRERGGGVGERRKVEASKGFAMRGILVWLSSLILTCLYTTYHSTWPFCSSSYWHPYMCINGKKNPRHTMSALTDGLSNIYIHFHRFICCDLIVLFVCLRGEPRFCYCCLQLFLYWQ